MELKITTLIENNEDDQKRLLFEHGLSLYIEFEGKKILFDTGQSGDFLENAKRLGIDVGNVDYLIISHGHYDHSGGVSRLLPVLEPGTKMYVGREFFRPKYKRLEDGTYKYNGIAFSEEDLGAYEVDLMRVWSDVTYLDEHIVLFKNFPRANRYERINSKFLVHQNEEYAVDFFPDEIALGLITSKGLVLVTGCSHPGIANILFHISRRIHQPVYAVLGGTHLVEADEERLEKTAEAFKKMHVSQIAVSHCTGERGAEKMQQVFGDAFIRNNTGHVYTIG